MASARSDATIKEKTVPIVLPNGLAVPTRTLFDPWNSASTGHQRAESRLAGSTSWRESRNAKLKSQYKAGLHGGGGNRMYDSVGAGSENFGKDGRKENGGWVPGASGLRTEGQQSLWECTPQKTPTKVEADLHASFSDVTEPSPIESRSAKKDKFNTAIIDEHAKIVPQIFRNLVFYINGSTGPTVSDHKLKYLITSHGGSLSIALGRRTVTHVILGTQNGNGKEGCGGGLAASKIQKEVTRIRGNAVNYVSVEWVMQSIDAGKRLPEARSSKQVISTASSKQKSVMDAFKAIKGKTDNAKTKKLG